MESVGATGAAKGAAMEAAETEEAEMEAETVEAAKAGAAREVETAVGDDDPRSNPQAVRYDRLTYDEVLARDLKVADATAISLCRDNALPIVVFNLLQEGNIARACRGERIGTLVSSEM